MLILTRKLDESITVGNDIKIIVDIKGKYISLGIDAPRHIAVNRLEICKRNQRWFDKLAMSDD